MDAYEEANQIIEHAVKKTTMSKEKHEELQKAVSYTHLTLPTNREV